ncbi:MAG: RecX family transcriptional regulator [Muribaculaceae bacterium]|nr:RecX family transcriptional regulator [Muribaculaceae bacterium]
MDTPKRKKTMTPQDALMRLEALCAQSEQCTYDLRQKLYRWGITSTDSKKIIATLIKTRFVDDARFAVAYCRDKYRFNRWGRLKIVYGLRAKQIQSSDITLALETIDAEEYAEILVSVVKSKASTIKDVDTYEGRTRLFRSVASRGYEPSLIAQIIKEPSRWT